jgi:peptidyl-prolyl cis-trans isomerase SurA
MNKFKYLTTFFCLVFSQLATAQDAADELATGPPAPTESGKFLDGIAAIVNEGVVTRSELVRQIATIEQRAKTSDLQLPPADILQEQVLERLIVDEVQMQRAERVGIVISDQMLNGAIAQVAADSNIPFEKLPEVLQEDGIQYSDYRAELRKQLTMDQLRRIEVMGRIAVSQREIDQCLADLEDNVVVDSDYNLSHIFISIPDAATGVQISEAEQVAEQVYQQIVDGADFSEMAVRYSDSDTALEGGTLGWRKGSDLPTLFFDIMNTLEEGQVSRPVRNVSGFHLVKINELRSANQHSEVEQTDVRHILVIPNEIMDDATAKQRLEEAVERINAGEDFAEIAKLMSDDPGSVNEGGDMGWSNPGTFVKEFEEVASKAEIGVVSAPFRSQFGWHILEVKGRRTYDNTEDLKAGSCVNRIRNSKLSNETELWVRRLRDEAYVDIRI